MFYELLAIDLDGTLLGDAGSVSLRNTQAIHRVVEAGVSVVVCTGRGHVEARAILDQVGLTGPHVFNTGAMVVDHPSGKTLARSVIDPACVRELVERFWAGPSALLLYRDQDVTGHDCLVTGAGEMTENSLWWYEHIGAKIERATTLTDAHYEHTVRVGMVGPQEAMTAHLRDLQRDAGDRFEAHAFEAVLEEGTGELLSILEVFAPGINKWHGIQSVCRQLEVDPKRVAFIGDQINDLSALRHASLGIAVGNAVAVAEEAADWVLEETNKQDAVAVAIERLLGVPV